MSRRKPTLGIGGAMNRISVTKIEPPATSSLGLLGAYADDESENETVSTKKTDIPPPADSIDSKVMDFLKEIDSLEEDQVQNGSTEASSKVEEPNKSSSEDKWGNWKQCVDEKTKHPYYWNTVTNEVTWDLPAEVVAKVSKTKDIEPTKKIDIENNELLVEEKPVKVGKVLLDSNAKKSEINDIDIEAELDSALEGKPTQSRTFHEDIFSTDTLSELELELLRVNDLPLSYEDARVLMKKYKDEIYYLKEKERIMQSNDTWKDRLLKIDDMRFLIRDNKDKWKIKMKDILVHVKRSSSTSRSSETRHRSRESSLDRKYKSHKDRSASWDRERSDKKSKINKLASTLLAKLDYLEVRKDATSLTLYKLLISIETRLKDWQEEEIRSSYLLKKLKENNQKMKSFEISAMPPGWSCYWDSSRKRYYFQDDIMLETQSSFPSEGKDSQQRYDGGFRNCLLSVLGGRDKKSDSPDHIRKRKTDLTDKLFRGSLNPKRHRSESPVTTQRKNDASEPSKLAMKSNDNPPLPPSQPDLPPLPPCPPSPEEGEIGSDEGVTMEMSDGELETVIITAQTPIATNQTNEREQKPTDLKPLLYQQQNNVAATAQTTEPKKVKKLKKKKVAGVNAKAPKKHLHNLVGKWERAKQEMEEEERKWVEEESEEDDPQKKIEEWKLQQIISGGASKNPNFEPVGDAWKNRVKKRVL